MLSKKAVKLSIDTGSLFAILDAYSRNLISAGLPPVIRLRVRRFGIYTIINIFLYLLEGCREGLRPTEEANRQKVLKSCFCRENGCFSTIVFFETVLLDVRNQMKNVFDE